MLVVSRRGKIVYYWPSWMDMPNQALWAIAQFQGGP